MRVFTLFCITVMFSFAGCQVQNTLYPKPTEFAHTDEGKVAKNLYKQKRKAWMEEMHRTAPDVDWRQIEDANRKKKIFEKLLKRKLLKASGILTAQSSAAETIEAADIKGSWIERGSNNLSGRMVVADFDLYRTLIYAGSAGGNVWRGTPDGSGWQWESLNDFMKIKGIENVRLLPKGRGQRLVVSQKSPSTFYYTDDDGLTWNMASGLENAVKWGSIKRTVITSGYQPAIYILLKEWDYGDAWKSIVSIYKSVDQGADFTKIHTFTDDQKKLYDIWTPRYESQYPFIIAGDEIYQLDENDNLNMISTIGVDFTVGDSSHSHTNLAGIMNDSLTTLYALYTVSGQSKIYRSVDAGQTWEYRGQVDTKPFFEVNSFTCSTQEPDIVYVGGVDCFRSYDGGVNWAKVNSWTEYYGDIENKLHADIPGINVFRDLDGDEFILISTDGGIYISRDDLQTVDNLSLHNLRISQYYNTYTHRTQPAYIFAASQDQGFQRTLSAQSTPAGVLDFDQLIAGDYGHIVSADDGESIWAVYPSFAIYYPNAKTSKTNYQWDFEGMSGHLWMPPLMEDPKNPANVYLAGGSSSSGAHIWHLKTQGKSINSYEQPYDFSGGVSGRKISAMAYSPIDYDYRYVLTNKGDFYYSMDGGNDWTKSDAFDGPDGHYFYGSVIVASPVNIGEVFIAGSGYSNPPVYHSTNHGQSFTAYSTGIPDTLVYDMDITSDGLTLFAATEIGPYIRLIDQGNWIDLAATSGPDQVYWSVEYIPTIQTARFGTYGRGIWDFKYECYTGPHIDQWYAVDKPDCWCANINPRQCHGDADGKSQGRGKYWVSTDDLDILIAAWNKPLESLTGNQICADFDHLSQGKSKYRVSTEDLDILITNWNIPDKPNPNCP
ncbi:MAG: WD40/YVTN/BNR-like repeat-containing protein [Planctomycetota bacterium]